MVDQAPIHGALAAHAFYAGAKNIGQVVAHLALVGHAGEAPSARQHTQERHLGQAHTAGAVINQNNFVTGQGHLVATACAGTVYGGYELQAAVCRGVLQAVARLVGEFAKVHLPGMAGNAQHEDVGPRAKHLFFGAGKHYAAHFGVLKADAVDRVVQLDVHAQVIAVEFELVAGAQARVFVKVGAQRGHGAVERQLPMAVAAGLGLVIHTGGRSHRGGEVIGFSNGHLSNSCRNN